MGFYGRDEGQMVVSVTKEFLILKLSDNREKHIKEYKKAIASYQATVAKELAAVLAKLQAGKPIPETWTYKRPVSHEREYTLAIDMLSASVDTVLKITGSMYDMYVNDRWDWKATFDVINSTYNAGEASSADAGETMVRS